MVSGQPGLEAGTKRDRQLLREKGTQSEPFWVEGRGVCQRQRGQCWSAVGAHTALGQEGGKLRRQSKALGRAPDRRGTDPRALLPSGQGWWGGRGGGSMSLDPTPGLPRPVCSAFSRCPGSFQHEPSAAKAGRMAGEMGKQGIRRGSLSPALPTSTPKKWVNSLSSRSWKATISSLLFRLLPQMQPASANLSLRWEVHGRCRPPRRTLPHNCYPLHEYVFILLFHI